MNSVEISVDVDVLQSARARPTGGLSEQGIKLHSVRPSYR